MKQTKENLEEHGAERRKNQASEERGTPNRWGKIKMRDIIYKVHSWIKKKEKEEEDKRGNKDTYDATGGEKRERWMIRICTRKNHHKIRRLRKKKEGKEGIRTRKMQKEARETREMDDKAMYEEEWLQKPAITFKNSLPYHVSEHNVSPSCASCSPPPPRPPCLTWRREE